MSTVTGVGRVTSGSESGSGQGCFVSGGPDWLFGLMLGAGTVALFYGFVWVSLLTLQGRPARTAKPLPGSLKWALGSLMLLNLASLIAQSASNPGDLFGGQVFAGGLLAVVLPGLGTLAVVSRRAVAAGTYPRARTVPMRMFWVSVVVSGLALAVAVSSLAEQIALGHPC